MMSQGPHLRHHIKRTTDEIREHAIQLQDASMKRTGSYSFIEKTRTSSSSSSTSGTTICGDIKINSSAW
ncbi:unnamed protein product [Amoebophrya sp. A25]|nr:unnamed protein product [Amoebophrya sp. A25]|eukprot:GSA25T00009781001.1